MRCLLEWNVFDGVIEFGVLSFDDFFGCLLLCSKLLMALDVLRQELAQCFDVRN